jgi:GTP-binding protein Era
MKKHVQVAIVGAPNVGKSSLLNSMINSKNSIVSPKPHTTRRPILGISHINDTQVIFVDTPGYIRPGTGCWSSSFIKSLRESVEGADVILIIIDATNPNAFGAHELLTEFGASPKTVVAINKSDSKKRMRLYPIAQKITEYGYNEMILLVSAKTGGGLDDLQSEILKRATNDGWLYDTPDQAKLAKPQYAAECVREKIFYCLNQEIPFQIWTSTVEFKESNKWVAHVNIYVARESHKRMVIGKDGDMIKRIGTAARIDLVSEWSSGDLFLNVEVDENKKKSESELHRICMVE